MPVVPLAKNTYTKRRSKNVRDNLTSYLYAKFYYHFSSSSSITNDSQPTNIHLEKNTICINKTTLNNYKSFDFKKTDK